MGEPFTINIPAGVTQVIINIGAGTPAQPPTEHRPEFWDDRLTRLGVKFQPAVVKPGDLYFGLVRAEWYDEAQAARLGPDHHIVVDVLDERGGRLPAQPLIFWWEGATPGDDRHTIGENSEALWGASFPMYAAGNAYNARVLNRYGMSVESDQVHGLGLGDLERPRWNIHTSCRLVWQLKRA